VKNQTMQHEAHFNKARRLKVFRYLFDTRRCFQ